MSSPSSRRPSPSRWCSATSPPSSTRVTRPLPSDDQPPSPSTPTYLASSSAPLPCATFSTPMRSIPSGEPSAGGSPPLAMPRTSPISCASLGRWTLRHGRPAESRSPGSPTSSTRAVRSACASRGASMFPRSRMRVACAMRSASHCHPGSPTPSSISPRIRSANSLHATPARTAPSPPPTSLTPSDSECRWLTKPYGDSRWRGAWSRADSDRAPPAPSGAIATYYGASVVAASPHSARTWSRYPQTLSWRSCRHGRASRIPARAPTPSTPRSSPWPGAPSRRASSRPRSFARACATTRPRCSTSSSPAARSRGGDRVRCPAMTAGCALRLPTSRPCSCRLPQRSRARSSTASSISSASVERASCARSPRSSRAMRSSRRSRWLKRCAGSRGQVMSPTTRGSPCAAVHRASPHGPRDCVPAGVGRYVSRSAAAGRSSSPPIPPRRRAISPRWRHCCIAMASSHASPSPQQVCPAASPRRTGSSAPWKRPVAADASTPSKARVPRSSLFPAPSTCCAHSHPSMRRAPSQQPTPRSRTAHCSPGPRPRRGPVAQRAHGSRSTIAVRCSTSLAVAAHSSRGVTIRSPWARRPCLWPAR